MTANGDRNLLFGILALQMDFINRDALVAAMPAWVLDKAKPLIQILVDQGALSAARRALLEPLVQEHIQQHGGDAGQSLAAVSSVGSAREMLKQIADPDVQASLVNLPTTDPNATKYPSAGDASAVGRRFLILRPHAVGGMAKVSVALDGELNREVALKEIREEHADRPDSRSRFLLEAEITGGLEHPSIVPIYGLGQYEDGRPFYAMRFIKGDSLKEAVERFHKSKGPINAGKRALELRQLLGRFNDVCDAVAYAHSRGVLHRDLKPGNVMLGKYGETLVVDWGLAKPAGAAASKSDDAEGPLQPSSADGSAPTQMGSAIGTPQFMPPEQAAGRLDQMGPASDVYSLGATLYCLLTGKVPIEGGDVGVVLQKVQRGDFAQPRQVKRDVPPALEAICLKAMALRPQDRYSTPPALASDVEKWLADEPVSAWREPWKVKARRWMGRHRTLLTAVATTALVALGILAAATALLSAANKRERDAKGHAQKLAQEKGELAEKEKNANADTQAALVKVDHERERAESQLSRARRNLFTTQLLRVGMIAEREPSRGLEMLHDYNACPLDLRDFTWEVLARTCRRERRTLYGHTGPVRAVAVSPDGKLIASGGGPETDEPGPGEVKLWDAATGEELATLSGHTGAVLGLAFSPDGKTLATGSRDMTAKLWDIATRKERATLQGHKEAVGPVLFSSDGKTLFTGSDDKVIRLWDVGEGHDPSETKALTIESDFDSMALSPDGTILALAGEQVSLWDIDAGKEKESLQGEDYNSDFRSVAFSPDGSLIAAGGYRGFVQTWRVSTGQKQTRLTGHVGPVQALAFSADGAILAAAGGESVWNFGTGHYVGGEVKLWEVKSGRELLTFTGHTNAITSIAFTHDNATLVTGSADGTLKVWRLQPDQGRPLFKVEVQFIRGLARYPGVRDLAFHPGGQLIAGVVASPENREVTYVRVWDVRTGTESKITSHSGMSSVTFSPDGKTLAAAGLDRLNEDNSAVILYDVETLKERTSLLIPKAQVNKVAFSPDGKTLAVAVAEDWSNTDRRYENAAVKLYEVATSKEIRTFRRDRNDGILALAFAPDGKTLATSAAGIGYVKFWDVDTGREYGSLGGLDGGVRALAFSPDGATLAAGSDAEDKDRKGGSPDTLGLFDVATRMRRATLTGQPGGVNQVAFIDNQTLASAGNDGVVKLWDALSGQERATLRGHDGHVTSLAFDPAGKVMASGGDDGTVRLWNGAGEVERAVFKGHYTNMDGVQWTRDGKRLLALNYTDWDASCAMVWDATTGQECAALNNLLSTHVVALSPNNNDLASARFDGKEVKLLVIPDGKELATFQVREGEIIQATFSADGKLLAVAVMTRNEQTKKVESSRVELWDVATEQRKAFFSGHSGGIITMDFSPDSRRFASGSGTFDKDKQEWVNGEVKLWDAETGQEIATLDSALYYAIFSPDGKTLATVGSDHKVLIWDGVTGRRLHSLSGHGGGVRDLKFSSDSRTLVTADYAQQVKLWDTATWRERATIPVHPGGLNCQDLSPDGKTLATGGDDRIVRLWDAATGRQLGSLRGHTSPVRSLSFSPDGTVLASGGDDKTVRLWNYKRAQ